MAQSRHRITHRSDVLMHEDGRKYLSRWFLLNKTTHPSTPRMHLFHSSDEETPHDHPSDFFAMALWGFATEYLYEHNQDGGLDLVKQRRVLPLVPRFTRAKTIHRIVDPRQLLTIVVFKPYRRRWGFWPLVDGVRSWQDNAVFRREAASTDTARVRM